MSTVNFAVVDIFSSTAYKGNPLAVVDDLAGTLSDTQLKLITRQFNLSETTFFFKPTRAQATYRLRSFLPNGREVLGIGHNILGAWWYLAEAGFLDFSETKFVTKSPDSDEFTFFQELGDAVMPVQILRTKREGQHPLYSVAITQAPPKAHGRHPDPEALARSIGLETKDIGLPDNDSLAPRVMSTASTYHLLVPIKSITALNQVVVERDVLLQQVRLADERSFGLFLFTPDANNSGEPGSDRYQARFFSPGMSTEDPATGSAAGPLSAYLYNEGHLSVTKGEASIEVLQGYNVGRECKIQVGLSVSTGAEDSHDVRVQLIGGGVEISKGTIVIPGDEVLF